VPTIIVEDGVAASLRRLKAKWWRRNRDAAFALWEQAGLAFDVLEVGPKTFTGIGEPDYTPGGGVSSEVVGFIKPRIITLVRSIYSPPAPKWWPMAWAMPWYSKGSAAYFHLERLRASEAAGAAIYSWDRTICHEVGHCLGLEHGSNGIMSGGMVPNQHEIDSVRAYYQQV
jgi:hypothetical protein